MVGKTAHESKVGFTSLTNNVQRQINKDVLLRESGTINSVQWNFFISPATGRGGMSQPLRDALNKAGIKVVEHYK